MLRRCAYALHCLITFRASLEHVEVRLVLLIIALSLCIRIRYLDHSWHILKRPGRCFLGPKAGRATRPRDPLMAPSILIGSRKTGLLRVGEFFGPYVDAAHEDPSGQLP